MQITLEVSDSRHSQHHVAHLVAHLVAHIGVHEPAEPDGHRFSAAAHRQRDAREVPDVVALVHHEHRRHRRMVGGDDAEVGVEKLHACENNPMSNGYFDRRHWL